MCLLFNKMRHFHAVLKFFLQNLCVKFCFWFVSEGHYER